MFLKHYLLSFLQKNHLLFYSLEQEDILNDKSNKPNSLGLFKLASILQEEVNIGLKKFDFQDVINVAGRENVSICDVMIVQVKS